jgi:serine/threonine protein kinase
MSLTPPETSLVLAKFPQIQNLSLLDTGGFKLVYRAEIGGRTEAFKLIQLPMPGDISDADAYRNEMFGRVRREVEALGKCHSKEIVKLGSVSTTYVQLGEVEYAGYSEEFLDGSDLWTLLNSEMQHPEELELRVLFLCLLNAIGELWGHGYVHRDIKPKNVIKLDDANRPFVLLDLGIAFSVRETALTFNPHERVLATYRYLAPEMMTFGFRESIDFRSDLYTAAMTVFEYGAQQHPLARSKDDIISTISRGLHQPPKTFRSLRPDLSIEFCQIVDQMLKKKPHLRPANLALLIKKMSDSL